MNEWKKLINSFAYEAGKLAKETIVLWLKKMREK